MSGIKGSQGVAILGSLFLLFGMIYLSSYVFAYAADPATPQILHALFPMGWLVMVVVIVALFLWEVARAL